MSRPLHKQSLKKFQGHNRFHQLQNHRPKHWTHTRLLTTIIFFSYLQNVPSSSLKDSLFVKKRGTDIPLLQKEVVRIT